MKIKTSELTGAALDWAVAKCEGVGDSEFVRTHMDAWPYSTNWAQGGPIIERMMRDGLRLTGYTCLPTDPTHCQAQIKGIVTGGPTPLIAAMRCRVASKLGDEVDVPDELSA
ncbi:phage protein NinX family protein [Rhodoferax mekongensis]|uniref:DUF2591 family protein n=1 Tax=Rhodoferax mekongensis TaxID=3068341 RepID=A0ABZ0B2V6_9BURK|nr:phage protein NinX family protein [Rhodoferax sp. TBRC 17307]WNO06024.1 DUF2591 family protein [Rhodoferax sp. TBRC 17307]